MSNAPYRFLVLAGLLVGGLVVASSSSGVTPQQPIRQQRTAAVEYAELTIQDGGYTFTVSGTNVRPRTYNLDGLYRFLGGQNTPNFVNLLGQIGSDGWTLVDVDPQRSVYLFKR